MQLTSLRRALVITAATSLSLLSINVAAQADTVQSEITSNAAQGVQWVDINEPVVVAYWVTNDNSGGMKACDATSDSPAIVTFNPPSGVTVSPTSLTFTGCDVKQSATFTAGDSGRFDIPEASVADLDGRYSTASTSFKIDTTGDTGGDTGGGGPTDTTAPVLTGSAPSANGAGWHNSAVTVTWTCVDETDGEILVADSVLSGEGADQSATATCTDAAGNSASSTVSGINIDMTPPVVAFADASPAAGSQFDFGDTPDASAWVCEASDATSGLAGPCSTAGHGAIVGSHTVTAAATDNADNTSSASSDYSVVAWRLTGFYRPVDMGGVVNTVKNGSTVPLKFNVYKTLSGEQITDVSAIQGFTVRTVNCSTSAETDAMEFTTTGGTSLRYDTTEGQFIQNWRTPKSPGSCYKVTMTTLDGSSLTALFKLK